MKALGRRQKTLPQPWPKKDKTKLRPAIAKACAFVHRTPKKKAAFMKASCKTKKCWVASP